MRLVVSRDEVHDGHITLLTIPMAATNTLLDALRIPGQVVIDDCLAELEIEPLRACFGADEHLRPRAEFMNQRKAYADLSRRSSTWWKVASLLRNPAHVPVSPGRDRSSLGR